MVKGIYAVCNCLNKVLCSCIKFLLSSPDDNEIRISERDLAEWKRIEGIDQYIQKRH